MSPERSGSSPSCAGFLILPERTTSSFCLPPTRTRLMIRSSGIFLHIAFAEPKGSARSMTRCCRARSRSRTNLNWIDTVRKHQQVVVQKQSLDLFTNPSVGKLIRVLPPHAFVFGVTTEYCVKLAALGLRKSGVKTVVISDAIAALGPESGGKAVEEMRSAGVDFITTDTLMGVLSA